MSQFAKDTIGLLNVLKINKTDVLGFSMGGFIAQELALNNPEKINKLVIYASNCGGSETILPTNDFGQIIQNKSKSIDEILNGLTTFMFPSDWIQQNLNSIKKFKEGYKAPPVISLETIQKQGNAVFSWYKTGVCNQLEKIHIPTEVIVGTKDMLIPQGNSLILVKNIQDSWLIRIPGGGHGLMYQYPDKLVSIIETFLK
ncbi:MAG: alpha/beta hydrolase [Candidatus Nitrosocosmicus sp.]